MTYKNNTSNINRKTVIEFVAILTLVISIFLPSRIKNIIVNQDFDLGDIVSISFAVMLFMLTRLRVSRYIIVTMSGIVCACLLSILINQTFPISILKYIEFFLLMSIMLITLPKSNLLSSIFIGFIFVFSIVTILSSLFHAQFQSLFGWEDSAFGLSSGVLRRARSFVGGPILTAEFLIAMLCVIKALKYRFNTLFYLLINFIIYAAITLTFSRIAIIIATILIFYNTFNAIRGRRERGIVTFVFMSVLLLIYPFTSFTDNSNSDLFGRLTLESTINSASDDGRVETLQNTLDLLSEYPIFGMGPKSLFVYKNLQSNQDSLNTIVYLGKTFLIEPHNLFLFIMQEVGFLGLTFFIIFWLLIIYRSSLQSNILLVSILAFSFTSSDLLISSQLTLFCGVIFAMINQIDLRRKYA